jgi:hypothetical protein
MRIRRLVEATRRHLEANGPGVFGEPVTTIGVVILGLLADEPDFLAEPLPPFGELFEGTGLDAHRNFIGFAGRDWSVLDHFEERVGAAGDEDDGVTLAMAILYVPVRVSRTARTARNRALILWGGWIGLLVGLVVLARVAVLLGG